MAPLHMPLPQCPLPGILAISISLLPGPSQLSLQGATLSGAKSMALKSQGLRDLALPYCFIQVSCSYKSIPTPQLLCVGVGGQSIAGGVVADTRYPVWEQMKLGLDSGKLPMLRAEHNRQGPELWVPRSSWDDKAKNMIKKSCAVLG